MNTYADTLAPWEGRNAYYKDVKLGKGVGAIKTILKDQTDAMIAAQIDSADEIISSQDIAEEALQEISYSLKSVGQGMSGLKAAFESKIQELSAGVSGKKKKGGPVSFVIQFLCGQIVALPFGWFIGMPLGIGITEGLLIAICFYVNVIQPQSQWKEIDTKKNEQEKLMSVVKKI